VGRAGGFYFWRLLQDLVIAFWQVGVIREHCTNHARSIGVGAGMLKGRVRNENQPTVAQMWWVPNICVRYTLSAHDAESLFHKRDEVPVGERANTREREREREARERNERTDENERDVRQGNHVVGGVDFDLTFRVHTIGHATERSFVPGKTFQSVEQLRAQSVGVS
jgi:hypothetical protein